ncbi:DUF3995 domain-containing protein [Streptomyces sp. NPDC051940]|uniref:DUF3995 domain-containing protein n=1 Tax=Streptomyces sp. NPDC051940 TaxID=3155675 RepID=UPI003439F161
MLGVDGLIHLYWATGATWPAGDRGTLSYAVLGADVPFTPGVLLPLAALLFGGAATVALRARHPLLRYGTVAVGAGLTLRTLAGLAWMTVLDTDAPDGSAFHWLNPVLYTPLCAVLAAASFAAVRREDSPRAA